MTTMPVLTIHDTDKVSLDSIAMPQAGDNDVLVKVAQCGICGSDLGYIAMGGLLGPGEPMRLGHELSGTVVETGVRVHHVRKGDRVVVNPMAADNRIGNGGPEGGFAPYLLVRNAALDPAAVLALPDTLDFELGALVEPLAVSMHGVHQGRAEAGQRVAVFGAGPIGLGIVMVLRHYGIEDVVVVDRVPRRLALAEELGATPFDASDDGLEAFLREQHGSAEVMGMPVAATDLYFEATGVGAVFNLITGLAKTGARVVVVGVHKAPVQMDLVNLLMRELTVTGSMAYPQEFPQVIEMLAAGGIDPRPLISHRYALSDFPTALSTAASGSEAIKIMVDCQA